MIRRILILLLSVFALYACNEGEIGRTQIDNATLQLVYDEVDADDLLYDIMAEVEDADPWADDIMAGLKSVAINECPVKTVEYVEEGSFPVTITLDFGNGCEGGEGKIKSGIIIITKTARYLTAGNERTITFENFTVDSVMINGTKTIRNDGVVDNKVVHAITADVVMTLPDGTTVAREIDHTREWIAGFDTPRLRQDDVMLISGSTTVSRLDGTSYTRTIIEPLMMQFTCRYMVSGTVEIIRSGESPAIIDYGDGECDDTAMLTQDGATEEITIRRINRQRKQHGK